MSSAPRPLPPRTRSMDLAARAAALIPGGTQTLAKGPGQWVQGVAPGFLERAAGSRVWDVDGNAYVDWTMAVGPLVLGYCAEVVDRAIRTQLEKGITFTLPHPLEVEVAERIARLVPNAEMVRFSKTGADVTSAAVRLARAHTGRDMVVSCGYHGWHDWTISTTDRARGVPEAVREHTCTFEYNDVDSLRQAIGSDVACVILEPAIFEEPRDGFLAEVRRLCDQSGALLIFDEMWTGFRVSLGGAQQRWGVTADLACFSKAVANGMPLSVLTGRREVMTLLERDVFFYTTFGGEALSLAAAAATLDEIEARDVPTVLAARGRMLREALDRLLRRREIDWIHIVGLDCRLMATFDPDVVDPLLARSLLQQEMILRGVLWNGSWNLSFAHGAAELEETLGAFEETFTVLDEAVRAGDVAGALRGAPVEPLFRRVSGFHTRPRSQGNGARP